MQKYNVPQTIRTKNDSVRFTFDSLTSPSWEPLMCCSYTLIIAMVCLGIIKCVMLFHDWANVFHASLLHHYNYSFIFISYTANHPILNEYLWMLHSFHIFILSEVLRNERDLIMIFTFSSTKGNQRYYVKPAKYVT